MGWVDRHDRCHPFEGKYQLVCAGVGCLHQIGAAAVDDDWLTGGMADLQERSDLGGGAWAGYRQRLQGRRIDPAGRPCPDSLSSQNCIGAQHSCKLIQHTCHARPYPSISMV
jgi:hypothetical protein